MRRPNFLIIYTDQQRWDGLGANGNPDIHTPHLDRLASQSVNFDHCFVQNPVCMPSRLSFLTGQYPSTLGVTHMGVPVPEDTVTLPRLLAPYGYRSANIGKLHFQPHANRDHRTHHPPYGFDHLEISDEPGSYEDAYRAWVRHRAPDQLPYVSWGLAPMTEIWQDTMKIEDGIDHPPERFPKRPLPSRCRDDMTHTAFVAEQSIEFMRQQTQTGQPFLCIAGIYSPHSPWIAPQHDFDLYDPASLNLPSFPPEVEARRGPDNYSDDELRLAHQGYYGQISEVDHHVGRLLGALDELGIADETVVIFTSDHGEWLGEHLKYGKGYPAHDQCSRVPLLIRPFNDSVNARTDSGLTEALDVLPTILDLAAIQIPPTCKAAPCCPACTTTRPAPPPPSPNTPAGNHSAPSASATSSTPTEPRISMIFPLSGGTTATWPKTPPMPQTWPRPAMNWAASCSPRKDRCRAPGLTDHPGTGTTMSDSTNSQGAQPSTQPPPRRAGTKPHPICRVSDLPPGERKIVEVRRRAIGVFNVHGEYYALRSLCPHQGAPLCRGTITGTARSNNPGEIIWERDGQILRCPWHGWEFDIATGRSVFNPHRLRVRTYDVTVEQPEPDEEDPSVESFEVTVEDGWVVLHA